MQDSGEHITVTLSDMATISGKDFSLSGDVIFVASDKNLSVASACGSMTASAAINSICACGDASFEQHPYHGKGNKITINPRSKTLIVEGNAEITDINSGTISGDKLILDQVNQRLQIEGNQSRRSVISIDDITRIQAQND